MKRLITYINQQLVPAQTRKEERLRVIKMFGALVGLSGMAAIITNTDVSTPVFVLGVVGCLILAIYGFIHSVI